MLSSKEVQFEQLTIHTVTKQPGATIQECVNVRQTVFPHIHCIHQVQCMLVPLNVQ